MDEIGFNIMDREALWLAPYAMHSCDTAGREYDEPSHPYRGPYQRDRDRIVHSSAYRRLAHKTQVFAGEKGDYHRTRLTHTLEVASIARTIGRVLRLNEDLIEALALMHDIGHPPFGHAGEDILDEFTRDWGGFNHNQQAVRIVTQLEYRYPEFPGLNLSKEILAGQRVRDKRRSDGPRLQPLLEVQVVDAADSIAYDAHDADDALELGLLEMDDLLAVPLWEEAVDRVKSRYAALDAKPFRRAVIHQILEMLVSDLVESTCRRLEVSEVASPEAASGSPTRLVAPSEAIFEQKSDLEKFLFTRVYRHPVILTERALAGDALREMFHQFSQFPERLPQSARARLEQDGVARVVCDFLAGMTDRFALEEHRRQKNT
ncbi:MAG: dNTP triphosphohydrolase [Planctomycetes bacterium]|nr:dNTP triphosphohydrolase [Planctomycetota bacterium]